ncbi:MAG: translesion error-prone DNA polymerase V autoproteolytic subunit [Tunicatimonas sp.]
MTIQPNHFYRPALFTPLVLPFYGDTVSAGFPSPATDHEEQAIDLNKELIPHPSSTFLVRASGNSMVGAGIFDGDLLVVDRSVTARDGHVVIAAVYGELTVKRLRVRSHHAEGRQLILAAENPDYPDIYVSDAENSVIWGVVRHAVRDLLTP